MPLYKTVEITTDLRLETPTRTQAARGALAAINGVPLWRQDLERLLEFVEEALR